tara:strand:- start:576 stop:986 length:411 start_codon:yes stop_codon:yes gene_type:complete
MDQIAGAVATGEAAVQNAINNLVELGNSAVEKFVPGLKPMRKWKPEAVKGEKPDADTAPETEPLPVDGGGPADAGTTTEPAAELAKETQPNKPKAASRRRRRRSRKSKSKSRRTKRPTKKRLGKKTRSRRRSKRRV